MTLVANSRLGPYEIVGLLGAGGMGEVYRARDPRLSRDVAVKLITADGASSPERLHRFETEARAAAQLAHPNVVTVFDVGTHDGHPYLVLELLDGQNLRETLRGGVPPLRQSLTWALEAARGLGAAHERGIVHRDLKPENIFLTRQGRVKVLDFGLAKLQETFVGAASETSSPTATKDTSPGVVLGTVGYMSPEQVKGEPAGARADVFALGAMLYELLSGQRAFGGGTAGEILASILRDEPSSLMTLRPEIPASVESVVRRCLGKHPSERFASGNEVAVALETVLSSLEPSRATGARVLEPRGPYPGLSSFTEADAERFFGREAEVEALWDKLRQRPLLALIGPSGAGKTSFVRAGLVPSCPSGWKAIVSTPGNAPMRALAQSLVGELPSDAETTRKLLAFDDPDVAVEMVRKWRQGQLEGLLILDQFEELFTLNPPEQQEQFAELIGRLIREADVHVLLSLRDDFLMGCDGHETLRPVFGELTPLSPLSEDGLRRALTEPAKQEGFEFEDEALVLEMLESVEGARGALPLLAFAVARLWEKRDREKKLLTRKAYEQVGGVAGALAQHAEQTLERIGLEKEPIVRELFRNLVTAQWTRAVADREELLSVVPDRESAEQVLDALVDARLLTSYEAREPSLSSGGSSSGAGSPLSSRGASSGTGDEGSDASSRTTHRIEIVHESLLRAWPRLVRWQAQDEEGAVLRDQLKQAAHLWEEKGRSPDVLWTGTAFQEFELWRDRYQGKLTALEDEYAQAMIDRVRRHRRVRKAAVAAVVVVSLGVAAVVSVMGYREARARAHAEAEALRAESQKLLALGQLELGTYPTAALAYAIKSLELADTAASRRFAVQVLQRGPTATVMPAFQEDGLEAIFSAFSPNGEWFALGGYRRAQVRFHDGRPPLILGEFPSGGAVLSAFGPQSDLIVTQKRGISRAHSLPDGEQLWEAETEAGPGWFHSRESGPFSVVEAGLRTAIRRWPLPGRESELLGWTENFNTWYCHAIDAAGSRLAFARGPTVYVRSLKDWGSPPRVAGEHPGDVEYVTFHPDGSRIAAVDGSGEVRIWPADPLSKRPLRALQAPPVGGAELHYDPSGTWLAWLRMNEGRLGLLWDLDGPPDAEPLVLLKGDRRSDLLNSAAVHPSGRWLVTNHGNHSAFWPLAREYPRIIARGQGPALFFTPDGDRLITGTRDALFVRPLSSQSGPTRELHVPGLRPSRADVAPSGELLAAAGGGGRLLLVPLSGAPVRELEGFSPDAVALVARFDAGGRRLAAAIERGPAEEKVIRVWDLDSGQVQVLQAGGAGDVFAGGIRDLEFLGEDRILTAGWSGLWSYDRRDGTREQLAKELHTNLAVDPNGRFVLSPRVLDPGSPEQKSELLWLSLETGESKVLTSYGRSGKITLDRAGEIVAAASRDGVTRVGSASGGDPYLLFGDAPNRARGVALSPDGRWVARVDQSGTVRLWAVPDGSPLHTLPHEELLAKLHTLTNLRVVEDLGSPTGYIVEAGPFPGWKDVPTW